MLLAAVSPQPTSLFSSLRFEHPWLLLLALLAIPIALFGWRAMQSTDSLRRGVSLALRAGLVLVLAATLAGPQWRRQHNHVTVIGLLDISGSVRRFADLPPVSPDGLDIARRSNIEYLRQWFRAATRTKAPDDRFGLVVFDGKAIAISAPTKSRYVDDNLDTPAAPGTNIADAVRLGLAMFPAETAKRIVLVTDGNETAGSAVDAIRQLSDPRATREGSAASASIPIDVLPIAYQVSGDVQVVRVEAPPTAVAGQTVTVRIVVENASSQPVTGSLTLRREGEPVDLSSSQPGPARRLTLAPGQSIHVAQVELGQTPINRFDATFEADDPATNKLPDNDRAEAFTVTPSKGSVLVLEPGAGGGGSYLRDVLAAADIPVTVAGPSTLPNDLLSLQNYDLVVLNNVPAADVSTRQQELLTRYVSDLGGGLIMVGGQNGFGAGGWNNTLVENLLPLELDPSRELRLPTAALVLVIDKSGSMNQPVAGARASQQEVANEGAALAIESLRADSLVGVVTFDMFAYVTVPLQPNDNPKRLAGQVRTIAAEGGTNFEPALERAYQMLADVSAAKKRVVLLSDGRSHSTDLDGIVARMSAANIQLTTIAVGDSADDELMQRLAQAGGGEFYPVRDPRALPRVLVDSVQVINKPLIKEVPFAPRVLATGSTLTAGMDSAPQLLGLVITSLKDDPKAVLEMASEDDEPLLAHWQLGLGRVAAFTSDAGAASHQAAGGMVWSQQWLDWPEAAGFWVQLARTISRPPMNQEAELIASIAGDTLNLTLEFASDGLLEADGASTPLLISNAYLQVDGTIYQPDGSMTPVRLRQTAPGRYEASADAPQAGNYIVALNPRQGNRRMAPVIGGASRSTSPEFRRYSSNLALLDEIVQSTGGRRLDIHDPFAAPLFDRASMPPGVSLLPAWKPLLWWALALLMLDVACRRLAWDANLLRSAAARAIARMTPASLRGREAAATLASLRRVSVQVDQRQETDAAGFSKFRGTGHIKPPPPRYEAPKDSADASGQAAPTPSRVTAALDALLGRGRSAAGPGAAGPDAPPPISSAGDETTAPATTRSLLDAKRRARRQLSGEPEGPHDQRDG